MVISLTHSLYLHPEFGIPDKFIRSTTWCDLFSGSDCCPHGPRTCGVLLSYTYPCATAHSCRRVLYWMTALISMCFSFSQPLRDCRKLVRVLSMQNVRQQEQQGKTDSSPLPSPTKPPGSKHADLTHPVCQATYLFGGKRPQQITKWTEFCYGVTHGI